MPLAEMVREEADIAFSPCFDDLVAVNFVEDDLWMAMLLKAILIEAICSAAPVEV